MTTFYTGILDGNHGDWSRIDLAKARLEGGIGALICKVTEGKDWVDPAVHAFVPRARDAAYLIGLYHFASASAPGEVQADFFLETSRTLRAAGPVLPVLDWEPNGKTNTMRPSQARAFVTRVHERTGRFPVVYTGTPFLNDLMGRVVDPVLAQCELWLAAYVPHPETWKLPPTWPTKSLHQYTNGGAGAANVAAFPRKTPGIGGCDRSYFPGTEAEFRDWWARHTIGLGADETDAVFVADPDQIKMAQTTLRVDVDGVVGPQTRAALVAFQRRNGLPRSGELDLLTWAKIANGYP